MSEMTPNKFTEVCKAYARAGRSIIPLADLAQKKPGVRWTEYQHKAATQDDVVRWFCGGRYPGVAVITGKVSGNLQCLDHDTKNDDGVAHREWRAEVDRHAPGLVDRLVHELSRSGGPHYYFICDEIEGGVTLAWTEPMLADDGKMRPKPLIETKENGRYVACFPTPGYKMVKGNLAEVPTITPAERQILHNAARLQNKNVAKANTGYRQTTDPNMPGNLYTQQATMAGVAALLEEAGWKEVRRDSEESIWYERPGKDENSTGANLKVVDGIVLFYVYTSSAPPFEDMKAHTAFQVLTFLKYDGDFKRCAVFLRAQGFGSSEEGEDEEKVAKPDAWAIATEMTSLIAHNWAFDEKEDCWRHWIGRYWGSVYGNPPAELAKMMGACINGFGRARINHSGQITGNLSMVKMQLPQRDFDARDERLINFNNGTLVLSPGKEPVLRPHSEADNLTSTLGYDYTPDLDFPNIRKFLRDTIPDDAARVSYAAHLGLALRSDTTMHKALVLIGGKNSGKSTAFRLSNMVCGNPHATGPGGMLFSEEQEGLRARASWHRRKLISIDEMPADALRYENTTKAMLAHSAVPMRHLNQREITEDNQWRPKVLFTCNEEPRFTDRTATVKRRLLYILCPNSREDEDPSINRSLSEELEEEVGAFVKYCLEQAELALRNNGYPESKNMKQYADRVELESDALKSFIHYECVFDPDAFTPSAALWDDYGTYCALNGHKGVLAKTGMVRAILQRYATSKGVTAAQKRVSGAGRSIRGLQGIRMRNATDPDIEDLYAV